MELWGFAILTQENSPDIHAGRAYPSLAPCHRCRVFRGPDEPRCAEMLAGGRTSEFPAQRCCQ